MNSIDIEMLVHEVENNPNYEVSYFDLVKANKEADTMSPKLKSNIKFLRELRRQSKLFEMRIAKEYELYRNATNKTYRVRNKFIEQCEKRAAKYKQS